MLRRTLLKLFTISPLAMLSTFKQIYLIQTLEGRGSDGSTIFTANPQYFRKRLPDLWSPHRRLVEIMANHCLATARARDTRGWTLKQWDEELVKAKIQYQIEGWENAKKRSAKG